MASASDFKFDDRSVPLAYEELFVPRFFTQFGGDLLSRTGVAVGDALLDVATGPGTLARLAALRIGPRGRVTGIDISLPMLEVARASSVPPLSAPITWIQSNAAPLDVEESSFDAVVCHQGLQFFPDRHAALTEMKRVLKPGGRIGIGVWGSLDQSPYFAAQVDSYAVSGAPALADKMRVPWSFPDRTALGEALERAGFRDVSIDAISFPVIFEGGVEQVLVSRAATPVGPDLAKLPAATRAAIDDAFRKRLSPLIDGHRVVSKMTSNVAVARR